MISRFSKIFIELINFAQDFTIDTIMEREIFHKFLQP